MTCTCFRTEREPALRDIDVRKPVKSSPKTGGSRDQLSPGTPRVPSFGIRWWRDVANQKTALNSYIYRLLAKVRAECGVVATVQETSCSFQIPSFLLDLYASIQSRRASRQDHQVT